MGELTGECGHISYAKSQQMLSPTFPPGCQQPYTVFIHDALGGGWSLPDCLRWLLSTWPWSPHVQKALILSLLPRLGNFAS